MTAQHSTTAHTRTNSAYSIQHKCAAVTASCPAAVAACSQAVQSRLDALENDNAEDAPDPFGLADGDDDEFVMEDSDEDGE